MQAKNQTKFSFVSVIAKNIYFYKTSKKKRSLAL